MNTTNTLARFWRALPVAALASCLMAAGAMAQEVYPSKPIRIIVPFGPGTGLDIMARLLGPKLTQVWGQPVIIENRAGAAGIIGTAAGARADPDGYTLTMAVSGTFGFNPAVYDKLPCDAVRDFEPIANLGTIAQTLLVHPSFKASSVKEFVDVLKSNPDNKFSYATVGIGSTGHMTMEMFSARAGIKSTPIPFKGSPDAQLQVINGEIPFMFESLPSVLPQIKAGKVRALAVSTAQRVPFLPEVPTIAESGYPGFEVVGWIGIVAPARTPAPILDKLNAELVRILNTAETKTQLHRFAFTPVGDSRESFQRYIREEITRWSKVAKDSGILLKLQ